MAYMEWIDDYSVGVAAFDDEHKKMIDLIAALHESMVSRRSSEIVFEILDGLIEYTLVHFSHEEKAFMQTGYPGAVIHRMQHEELKAQVKDFRLRAQILLDCSLTDDQHPEGVVGGSLVIELSRFMHDWLIDPIMGSDKRYGAHMNARGIV